MIEPFVYSDWAAFKAIAISRKNLSLQMHDKGELVTIVGPDQNGINLVIHLNKVLDDGTTNPDYTDFVENHEAASNWNIGQRSYPFSTPDMQFAGNGIAGLALKGDTTDIWFKLENGYYLTGGEYWTRGAAAGDTMQVDIVDKDGVYAPAGTVLVAPPYMKAWNVLPKDDTLVKFERNYAGKPPPNVYARFRYTSIGDVDVKFFCNLYLHKPL